MILASDKVKNFLVWGMDQQKGQPWCCTEKSLRKHDSSRWCQQAAPSLTWNTRMHWNPCCVSWHKEIYHKSRLTGKNASYSKEKSITLWMRLGLDKSAALISPLMENDSWYHHSWYQSNTQYSATFLGLSKLQEAIQKYEKMKCSNKVLDVLCKMQKGMIDKHTQD